MAAAAGGGLEIGPRVFPAPPRAPGSCHVMVAPSSSSHGWKRVTGWQAGGMRTGERCWRRQRRRKERGGEKPRNAAWIFGEKGVAESPRTLKEKGGSFPPQPTPRGCCGARTHSGGAVPGGCHWEAKSSGCGFASAPWAFLKQRSFCAPRPPWGVCGGGREEKKRRGRRGKKNSSEKIKGVLLRSSLRGVV